MPKKTLAFFILLIFLFSSCSRTLPDDPETAEIKSETATMQETETLEIKNETIAEEQTETKEIKTETATEEQIETPPPPVTTVPATSVVHSHTFRVYSIRPATCASAGERVWNCSCGETKNEYLPSLNHRFSEPSCTAPSLCSLCGLQNSTRLGHSLQGNTCTRCQKVIEAPVCVLGKELHFDATRVSVESVLGTPTEVITEGIFISLVYAEKNDELTVIQLDDVGLWGVFTLDPTAFFFLDGKTVSISNFSGSHDLNSDAYYQDIGSCRIFGFRDSLVSKSFYGLWLRYSECRYDYMGDPAVASSYLGQSRLSWYYTNALRAKNGLSALAWSDAAAKVATDYSKVMAEKEVLEHDGSFGDRLTSEGILWHYAGENISEGYFNLYFVCDAYYNSESHRENILNRQFTHVGMGYYQTALQKNVFGAQIFFGQ